MDESLGIILAFFGGAAIGLSVSTLGGSVITVIALCSLWALFLVALTSRY